MTIPRELILTEINKGIAAARAAHPDLIPHDAESMAAATLRITPTTTTKETDMTTTVEEAEMNDNKAKSLVDMIAGFASRLAAIEAATGITQGVQNVMVSRSDDTIESEDDDEVDAVLAEDAARMLRKHRQDMMRDIIGNKSYESLDSQVKHLRNITEVIDQLGRIY